MWGYQFLQSALACAPRLQSRTHTHCFPLLLSPLLFGFVSWPLPLSDHPQAPLFSSHTFSGSSLLQLCSVNDSRIYTSFHLQIPPPTCCLP